MFGRLTSRDTVSGSLRRRGQLRLVLLAMLLSVLFLNTLAASADFSSPYFRQVWQKADYPVAIGAAQRGFTWGPAPFFNSFEPYTESPNGQRRVEYYDKARMEITRPDFNPTSPYYVTNGLLVKEMVLGELQVGDRAFSQRFPAYDLPVAGDPVVGNPDAVTYASFYALSGAQLMNRQADRTNERVSETISRGGAVGRNDLLGSLDGLNNVYYERALGHNIPKVFWDFLNMTGQLYDGRNLYFGKVVDWVATMGYPITDAYWTKTVVSGVTRDVLVQLYERRVLTYTPTNPDPYKIEMGNVGRHYYSWRYDPRYDLSIPQQSSAEVRPEAGFPTTRFSIRIYGLIQGEDFEVVVTAPSGKVCNPVSTNVVDYCGLTFVDGSSGQGTNFTGFAFFPVYFDSNANTPPGLYTVYFRGVRSGNEAKAYFFVIGIPGFNLPAR
jgi:hypothetical protein